MVVGKGGGSFWTSCMISQLTHDAMGGWFGVNEGSRAELPEVSAGGKDGFSPRLLRTMLLLPDQQAQCNSRS